MGKYRQPTTHPPTTTTSHCIHTLTHSKGRVCWNTFQFQMEHQLLTCVCIYGDTLYIRVCIFKFIHFFFLIWGEQIRRPMQGALPLGRRRGTLLSVPGNVLETPQNAPAACPCPQATGDAPGTPRSAPADGRCEEMRGSDKALELP